VKLYVYSLYDEAVETVKLQDALSASATDSVWILRGIESEARLQNLSQSVRVSTAAEISLALT
jgi:hypothetical protein